MSGYYSGPSAEAGQGGGGGGGYGGENYEMHPQPQPQVQPLPPPPSWPLNDGPPQQQQQQQQQNEPISLPDFLLAADETATAIRTLEQHTTSLRQEQQRAISSAEPAAHEARINELRSVCRDDEVDIRQRMDMLKAAADAVPAGSQKEGMRRRFELRKREWQHATQDLIDVQNEFSRGNVDGAAREYQLVNPDVDFEEARRRVEMGDAEGGAFRQVLLASPPRTTHALTTLNSLQSRHRQLDQIQRSIADLAQLFDHMDRLVIQQDETVAQIEHQAEVTNTQLQDGLAHQEKAIDHAKNRNRLRKWCIFVGVLIVLVLGLGIGLGVGLQQKSSGN